jgi:hypothetical protein
MGEAREERRGRHIPGLLNAAAARVPVVVAAEHLARLEAPDKRTPSALVLLLLHTVAGVLRAKHRRVTRHAVEVESHGLRELLYLARLLAGRRAVVAVAEVLFSQVPWVEATLLRACSWCCRFEVFWPDLPDSASDIAHRSNRHAIERDERDFIRLMLSCHSHLL